MARVQHRHKVFFCGQPGMPLDYFVFVVADNYERLCVVLAENYSFMRTGNYSVVDRADWTHVCDDSYYQSLQPDCELLILVPGAY